MLSVCCFKKKNKYYSILYNVNEVQKSVSQRELVLFPRCADSSLDFKKFYIVYLYLVKIKYLFIIIFNSVFQETCS